MSVSASEFIRAKVPGIDLIHLLRRTDLLSELLIIRHPIERLEASGGGIGM